MEKARNLGKAIERMDMYGGSLDTIEEIALRNAVAGLEGADTTTRAFVIGAAQIAHEAQPDRSSEERIVPRYDGPRTRDTEETTVAKIAALAGMRPITEEEERCILSGGPAAAERAQSRLGLEEIMQERLETFQERFQLYGDSSLQVGPVLAALFPNGIELRTPDDFTKFHMLDWTVGKLVRFANSGMTHVDSVHDASNYLTMIEGFIKNIEGEDQ